MGRAVVRNGILVQSRLSRSLQVSASGTAREKGLPPRPPPASRAGARLPSVLIHYSVRCGQLVAFEKTQLGSASLTINSEHHILFISIH